MRRRVEITSVDDDAAFWQDRDTVLSYLRGVAATGTRLVPVRRPRLPTVRGDNYIPLLLPDSC